MRLPLEHGSSVMLNVFRTLSDQDIEMIKEKKYTCCDSGGLQILEALKKGKKVIVGPMLKTRNTDTTLFWSPTACLMPRRSQTSGMRLLAQTETGTAIILAMK